MRRNDRKIEIKDGKQVTSKRYRRKLRLKIDRNDIS